jgi:hypothetical protein
MDNRLDKSEDEQATPEHGAGKAPHGRYAIKQPDRSDTEVQPDARSIVEGQQDAGPTPTPSTEPAGTGECGRLGIDRRRPA